MKRAIGYVGIGLLLVAAACMALLAATIQWCVEAMEAV